MKDWPLPKTLKQLRDILDLTGYYCHFVRNYGEICRPLTTLLKKNSFSWTEKATSAFNKLKQAMVTTHVLAFPNYFLPFVLKTDASGHGIGAVLMQQGHPLAFLSKRLAPKHQSLSTYEKELLAIVMATQK